MLGLTTMENRIHILFRGSAQFTVARVCRNSDGTPSHFFMGVKILTQYKY